MSTGLRLTKSWVPYGELCAPSGSADPMRKGDRITAQGVAVSADSGQLRAEALTPVGGEPAATGEEPTA